jgi:hypothetical protein
MNKNERFDVLRKLINWKMGAYIIGQKMDEFEQKKLIELIEKKIKIEQRLAKIQKTPDLGVISTAVKLPQIRLTLFDLAITEEKIQKIFKENILVLPKYCFHPTIMQKQGQDKAPNLCLMCGHTYH